MNIIFLFLSIPVLICLTLTLWNVFFWKKVEAGGDLTEDLAISVLIPARNEEKNLSACLEKALSQGTAIIEVLVYDDHSTDSTPQIIKDFVDRDIRLRGLAALDLPAGWSGKNFACAQLASHAGGDWLLFLDADARLRPGAAIGMVGAAETYSATFVSCWGAFELGSFWERVLMPMLNFVVLTFYPAPLAMKRRDASLGLAHGACLLVHRETYLRLGGHEAVYGEIFEDVRLARHWRENGELSLCLDGQQVVSLRMYSSFSEIWNGFQKNFFPAFRHETSFWAFIAFHFFVFLMPFVLLPFALAGNLIAPLFVVLSVLAMRLLFAIRFGHPWWSAIFHPSAEVILLGIGISSWWKCKTKRGVQWKGRSYHDGN